MGMEGKVTRQQASKKWENLKKKYKDLRTPKTGSGTESGEVTVATWQYFDLMHEVLGARPAIDPPVLVSSIQDPMVILMEMVEPYTQAPPTAASTPVHPTTSIIPPRRRSKTVAELLAEEALQEQRRHEETSGVLDGDLVISAGMVKSENMPDFGSSGPSSRICSRAQRLLLRFSASGALDCEEPLQAVHGTSGQAKVLPQFSPLIAPYLQDGHSRIHPAIHRWTIRLEKQKD
ncbi:unnamed protein product [Boreogadus saida]